MTAASATYTVEDILQVHQFTCNTDWEPFNELTHIRGVFLASCLRVLGI